MPNEFLALGAMHIHANPQVQPFVDINTPTQVPYLPSVWHETPMSTLGVPDNAVAIMLKARIQFGRTDTKNYVATTVDFCTAPTKEQCAVNYSTDGTNEGHVTRNAYWKFLVPNHVQGGRSNQFGIIPTVNGVLRWRWDPLNWSRKAKTRRGSFLMWVVGYCLPAS
jgi:hypothetical protein